MLCVLSEILAPTPPPPKGTDGLKNLKGTFLIVLVIRLVVDFKQNQLSRILEFASSLLQMG